MVSPLRATVITAFFMLLLLPACVEKVTSIFVPSSASVNEEFCIVCDGIVSSGMGESGGVLIQVPQSMTVTRAYFIGSPGFMPVKRNVRLESTVPHEEGMKIIALTGSSDLRSIQSDSVRLLVFLKCSEAGQQTLKFIFGVPGTMDRRSNWLSVSPEGVYKFSEINDSTHTDNRRIITVTKAEMNGTAALEFNGERQFVTFPDTGLMSFSMNSDFSIELWLKTSDRRAAVLSTRSDDYTSYYPFELWIDRKGQLDITTADGASLTSTRSKFTVCDGMWHHVAVSYSSRNRYMRLIIDAITRDSIRIPLPAEAQTPRKLILAARGTRMHFLKATIDELRIWDVVKGEEEVAFYQNAVLSGFEDNLYALFNFEKGNYGVLKSGTLRNELSALAYNKPKLIMSTAPLLAEVISFSAFLDDETEESVILTWESFEDTDVKAYEVEKRTERGKFSVLKRFVPDSAKGNHQVYRFTDTFRGKDLLYYRLRRVNLDGSIYYSEAYPIGAETYHNFVLENNKPDPFVSGTDISITLTESTFVTLTVYNIMGGEVERLLADKKPAGTYTVHFDGTEHPAGMYFYKLRTNTGSQTKKMYLSK